MIFLIGLLGHVGQLCLNLGLQLETAATATLATCTQIVWSYIFELAFLHEALNRWSLIGTGLILGYMLMVAAIKMGSISSGGKLPETSDEQEASELTRLLPVRNKDS